MKYTESTINGKHLQKYSATIEEIEHYSEQVVKGLIKCNQPDCKVCSVPSEYFKHHEARQRFFLVVLDQVIKKITGVLMRWKCPGCGKTYTDYPWFAVPYKRYTIPTIMPLCNKYLDNAKLTYRRLIQKLQFGYDGSEKQLEHSTVHRWITTFGHYETILSQAQDLIQKNDPKSTICRDLAVMSISPKKHQSLPRKNTLLQCFRIIHIERVYRRTFDVSIFPKLATNCFFT